MEKINEYIEQRTINSIQKKNKILDELPTFCRPYFIAIENTTAPLSQLNYAYDLNTFFNYLIVRFDKFQNKKSITIEDFNNITSIDIEEYMSYLSYYTIDGIVYHNNEKAKARKLSALRSFFSYLYKKNMISKNESEKVTRPKLHDKEIIRLEVDEVVKLLNESETPTHLSKHQIAYDKKNLSIRDTAMLTLFLGTGIRVSECVGLDIDDIDFSTNGFTITRKGGNKTILYFSDEVGNELKKYLEYRKTLELPETEKALFISLKKRRISVRAVENLVKKYSQSVIPLKHITPHKLRSTYGTNLYKETKDIYIVADVLGHKDVNTTKKHYAAISDDIRRDASTKVKLRGI
jgi:integrase/recombinase XerC